MFLWPKIIAYYSRRTVPLHRYYMGEYWYFYMRIPINSTDICFWQAKIKRFAAFPTKIYCRRRRLYLRKFASPGGSGHVLKVPEWDLWVEHNSCCAKQNSKKHLLVKKKHTVHWTPAHQYPAYVVLARYRNDFSNIRKYYWYLRVGKKSALIAPTPIPHSIRGTDISILGAFRAKFSTVAFDLLVPEGACRSS